MIKITAQHEKFIESANEVYPGQSEFSKSQIKKICQRQDVRILLGYKNRIQSRSWDLFT